jgi:hypothetical protein
VPLQIDSAKMSIVKAPKPGEGEPIVFFDIELGGKSGLHSLPNILHVGRLMGPGLGHIVTSELEAGARLRLPPYIATQVQDRLDRPLRISQRIAPFPDPSRQRSPAPFNRI